MVDLELTYTGSTNLFYISEQTFTKIDVNKKNYGGFEFKIIHCPEVSYDTIYFRGTMTHKNNVLIQLTRRHINAIKDFCEDNNYKMRIKIK